MIWLRLSKKCLKLTDMFLFHRIILRCRRDCLKILWTNPACFTPHTMLKKKPDLSKKRAVVITVGTDQEFIDACRDHVAKWFCETSRIRVVAKKSFLSKSELKGNYNDIFENKLNPNIDKELENVAEKLYSSL